MGSVPITKINRHYIHAVIAVQVYIFYFKQSTSKDELQTPVENHTLYYRMLECH